MEHGPCLVAQVQLLADLHAEAVEHLQGRPGHLVPGLAHQDLEQRLHQVEVRGHHVLDLGPQHLDRDLAPVEQAGPVDHGDGGRTDGLRFELGERVTQGEPEVLLDPLPDVGERHGRAGVQAGPELVGHVVAEHAGRRRDDLTELHERATEVLEALAQRPCQLRRGQRAVADVAQLAEHGRGEVHAHHRGDGAPTAHELAPGRLGQAARVDPGYVLAERLHRLGRRQCAGRLHRARRCVCHRLRVGGPGLRRFSPTRRSRSARAAGTGTGTYEKLASSSLRAAW